MVLDREMTSLTHTEFLPTVWSDDTRDAIEFEEVLSKLVDTHYEAQMSIGRILEIPLRANMDTQTKSEGVSNTITFQSQVGAAGTGVPGTTPLNAQLVTISTYQYAAALLNAVVATQSKYDERQRLAHSMGYSLMRGVEVSIATLFSSFSQVTGTLGADLDDAILRRSWQYLRDAGVTTGANWIFGPAAVASLFGNNKFTSKDFISGKSAIESAQLPALFSYPVFVSNLLVNPAGGQTNCALLHREAIILIRQIKPTVREQYLIRNNADGLIAYDLYNASEAIWVSETPAADADPTTVDSGAVLIRSA
jgi:hypothetical protein